jgi:hypothetical protein
VLSPETNNLVEVSSTLQENTEHVSQKPLPERVGKEDSAPVPATQPRGSTVTTRRQRTLWRLSIHSVQSVSCQVFKPSTDYGYLRTLTNTKTGVSNVLFELNLVLLKMLK